MKKKTKDTSKLVYVERIVHTRRGDGIRRMWVAGDNVHPGDRVLRNEHNVRPYRHAKDTGPKPEYKPPVGKNTGAALTRRAVALFNDVLEISAGR